MGYGRLMGQQVLGVLPTVNVSAGSGSTVTLSKGGLTLNAVENNGVWTFTCPTFGTWIASDGSETSAVEVDNIKLYNTKISSAIVYGFHIDSSVSDPSEAVTYLEDAVGMTPAFMDYTNDTFNYGSWENAFFMPKPCMLKYDGTVDYYLDPNDYSKKADGTASDIADDTYGGNAMIEWGQNGKKIWYKIVPDTNDNTSASIYISDTQVDSDYHAWSFINNDGVMVDHFYTAIYGGHLDSNNRLRSMSGQSFTYSKSTTQEITYARKNNPSGTNIWYTEVFCDRMLITYLLVLMGKSLNSQAVFGQGNTEGGKASVASGTSGALDAKGLFYGSNGTTTFVKVFGMENFWGNQWHRIAGLMNIAGVFKVKMTWGTSDGSTETGYNTTGSGYITANSTPRVNKYVVTEQFDTLGFSLPKSTGGSATTYYSDHFFTDASGTTYAQVGGGAESGAYNGLFYVNVFNTASFLSWIVGASPSCKPSA